MRSLVCCLLLSLLGTSAAVAQAHILIISGMGGEARYSDAFYAWGAVMVDAARKDFGLPEANVVFLAESPDRDPDRINAASTRDNIERAIAAMATRVGPDERVLLLLIGHGSYDSRGSRLNLPGPDITAEELARHLTAFPTQPIVIVNAASSSGGFQEPLAGVNRTIITATRSGGESQETIFGQFFVAAFADQAGDVDKDGRVSIQEAYDYATGEVERSYETADRLQLEHARMEGDLDLARDFYLGGTRLTAPADASSELREMYAERQRLEDSVTALRGRSAQMDPVTYQLELEGLLLELARVTREIRQLEGNN